MEQISCQSVSCCCQWSLQSGFPALLAICFCVPAMMPVVLATYWLTRPYRQAREWQWWGWPPEGQQKVGIHLAQRGFSISFIWADLQEEDFSIMGVSLTKDRGPRGLSATDSIQWRITNWLMDSPGITWGLPGQDVRRSQNIRWYQLFLWIELMFQLFISIGIQSWGHG